MSYVPKIRKDSVRVAVEVMTRDHRSAVDYIDAKLPDLKKNHPIYAQAAKEFIAMAAVPYLRDPETAGPNDIVDAPTTVPMLALAIFLIELLDSAAEIDALEGGAK